MAQRVMWRHERTKGADAQDSPQEGIQAEMRGARNRVDDWGGDVARMLREAAVRAGGSCRQPAGGRCVGGRIWEIGWWGGENWTHPLFSRELDSSPFFNIPFFPKANLLATSAQTAIFGHNAE